MASIPSTCSSLKLKTLQSSRSSPTLQHPVTIGFHQICSPRTNFLGTQQKHGTTSTSASFLRSFRQAQTVALVKPSFASKKEEVITENSGHPKEEAPSDYVDFNTMKYVPDSYVWDNDVDAPYKDVNLPVVDFSGPRKDIMHQVSSACQTWGIFYLLNHGIPHQVFEQIEEEAHKLFALPRKEKLKAKLTSDNPSGFGNARYSEFFDKLMWFEGFTSYGSPHQPISQIMAPEDCDHFLYAHYMLHKGGQRYDSNPYYLHGVGVSLKVSPMVPINKHSIFDVIEGYQRDVHHLGLAIVELMLSSLGLSEDDIEWVKEEKANAIAKTLMTINYYPKPPEKKAVMGAAPHTDSLFITIVHQSNASGLQVWEDKEWLTVPPMSGALIFNVGDLFQVLSNGCFKSVFHRVLVNQNQNRYSFAHFWGTQTVGAMGPHPKLLSPSSPPLYQSLSWKEYIKIKRKHYTNPLDQISIKDDDLLHSQMKEQ